MDEALAWFRTFLEVEWDAVQALHLEPDEDVFRELKAAYKQLKDPNIGHNLYRGPDDFAELKEAFADHDQRLLIAAIEFAFPDGPGWGFLVSEHFVMDEGRSIEELFIVRPRGGSFFATSAWSACLTCDLTGTDGGATCETCEGIGFYFPEGEDASPLPPRGEVRTFDAPTHPDSAAAYRAL